MAKESASKKEKKDPFATRKTKETSSHIDEALTPPAAIAQAIDEFRELQEQAKHFEGEANLHKDAVSQFCLDQHVLRVQRGQVASFKVMGRETMITYVVMDSSAGLTEEDSEQIVARWGSKAAEELIERDFKSIRFNDKVLEAHYDKVVDALQSLPEEILDNLFKPMLLKVKPNAAANCRKFAKDQADLKDLITALKLKSYIR